MNHTGNENISLYYHCCTKDSTACSNRSTDLDDYIDLYYDEDPFTTDEQYAFYIYTVRQ